MKYCNNYAALLDLFVDGELTPAEMADVQAHLDTCPGCRAYVDDALTMRAAFPEVEDTVVPAGFAEGVMAAVAASAPVKKPVRKNLWLKTLMPLAACLAVVIVLQNGPVSGGGGWSAGGSKATASPSAAPAATESAMETAEAPAAAMPEEAKEETAAETTMVADTAGMAAAKAATGGTGAAEDGAPTEAYACEPEAFSCTAANETGNTAYFAQITLTAEQAQDLLTAFTPAKETDIQLEYELTAEEFETLLAALDAARIVPTGEIHPADQELNFLAHITILK